MFRCQYHSAVSLYTLFIFLHLPRALCSLKTDSGTDKTADESCIVTCGVRYMNVVEAASVQLLATDGMIRICLATE